jgi:hypothetical protein
MRRTQREEVVFVGTTALVILAADMLQMAIPVVTQHSAVPRGLPLTRPPSDHLLVESSNIS